MTQAVELLQTQRLRVRNWQDGDRALFREINADPQVMEFFPHRRTADEADRLMDEANAAIAATGYGIYALERKDTADPIGFCALMPVNLPGIFPHEAVEIGWRLATRFWRQGYASEAARALLDHAFDVRRLDAVVSFAVAANLRSIAVMERLGLVRIPALDFDHPRVPDTHPHLKRHLVFAVTRDAWHASRQTQQKTLPIP
ncbi:GNAT family N-acetyltransferase [Rhizobiaceae bacterium BDR2-2]|uniref:GNAT family N-acetyltransferase n=1 Tax=Ectorhizobium quercum TaxID=2965071 RepID=A0AAE3SU88_9HYPH|nr:GNAT family N-acetyltransferase [Ectorhizobium quercum]MCX8996413.1 GNAT family N-acetyltransferase [Ectorhizobium quercum]